MALLAGCSPWIATVIEVERDSPAIRDGELVQAVGIATLGDVFTPWLEAGCHVPCEATHMIGTAADDQEEISLDLFRGTETRASRNHSLGRFVITRVPAAPRGRTRVTVTLRIVETDIDLEARGPSGAVVHLERRPASASPSRKPR